MHKPDVPNNLFVLPPDIQLGWLMRSDVRNNAALDDPEARKMFLCWWVLFGAKEYHRPLTFEEKYKSTLFETLPGNANTFPYTVCRLASKLASIRSDVPLPANLNKPHELLKWNSWFFVYGLKEHGLLGLLDKKTIELLNAHATSYFEASHISVDSHTCLPWIMIFAWQMREDLQQAFDLNNPEGQARLILWFWTGGCVELGLTTIISKAHRKWLTTPITINQTKTNIPLIAYLLWQAREDLQKTFDLKTAEDQQHFSAWIHHAVHEEQALKWLATELLKPKAKPKLLKNGVNLIGFAYGELGIGEDVRMAAAACTAVGIPFDVISIAPGEEVRQADYSVAQNVTEKGRYATNIFCLTGFDTAHLWLKRGEELFNGRYNIGWWPWELPVWPQHWQCAFDFIDEIWAATEFTYKMYRAATQKPVQLMPLPVKLSNNPQVQREKFGLPEHRFLFLYIFDFNSYLARKNPWAAVEAFSQAFPKTDKQVGLVLKTMNSRQDNPLWQQFCARCAEDKRIILIQQTLDRADVINLVASCDAYISLHRSEGFGRTLAEAMLLGKPVVATDFSGNVDFLTQETGFPVRWQKKSVSPGDYPFVVPEDNAYWAEPELKHAAMQMQAARKASEELDFAEQIRQYAEVQFSVERIGKKMAESLVNCRGFIP